MTEVNITIEKAVEDLSAIRNSLERLHSSKASSTKRPLHSTWLILQAGAFFSSAILLVTDFFQNIHTSTLMASAHDPAIRSAGLAGMGLILFAVLVATYGVIWRSARNVSESFSDHIARYFSQLSALSFCSDLFVKFVTLVAVISAQRPEWMAPLLFLFTADYLLQGRLFMLPVKASIPLALICLAGGVAQFLSQSGQLVYPLFAFTVISGVSLTLHYTKIRNITKGNA